MKILLFTVALLMFPAFLLQAQTTVTFNVDLRPMMEDSTFIPGKDIIQVTGNIYPLGNRRAIKMTDEAPADSIYSVKLDFSRRNNNERLIYSFEIVKPDRKMVENAPRSFILNGQNVELTPVSFNTYVH